MEVFVFSSNNLTNMWAGVGAKRWAVSMKLAKNKGTITKSKKIKIGSIGLLYCSETGELTTPFLITSLPEAKYFNNRYMGGRVGTSIWNNAIRHSA